MIWIDLIYNLALLVALSVVSGFIDARWARNTRAGVVLQGLLFGGAAVIGMLRPFAFSTGLIFDGRSVMISLGGLFFGPWTAAVACLMTISLRLAQGGSGSTMGVLVILASAAIGVGSYFRRPQKSREMSAVALLGFGTLVHLAMLAMTLALPFEMILPVLRRIAWPVMLVYPLATVLIGKILSDQVARYGFMTSLQESEERYRELVEQANSIILRMDVQGRITFFNEFAQRFFGFTQAEILGRNVVGTIVPVSDSQGQDLARVVRDIAEHPERYPSHENENLRKDGTRCWVAWTNKGTLDPQGRCLAVTCVGSDITARKELEVQLRHAQKLEAIGQLAGGVAHDFNNILAAMMMNLSLLQEDRRLSAETQEALQELMVGAKRATSLTRQLLLFSRRSVLEVKRVDLNELVANLLKMLGRLIGEHITVRFERREALPPVEADPGMIEQVLMNLAVNARDAMPAGGRLTIEIQSIEADAQRVKGKDQVRPGLFVCLTVADNGCGMEAATLQRIFEPFFTTKEAGKGTGLGLATVYGIVVQHKGWVEAASEIGKGSTFRVFLPTATTRTPALSEPKKTTVLCGHETILLVEDETSVRQVVSQGLRRLGYRVLEAGNGQDAMVVWRQRSQQIDLLFSDMVMPEGMTGLELAENLRQEKPALKILISSGYHTDIVGQGRSTGQGITYLQKPYQFEALWKSVRDCLDRTLPGQGFSGISITSP